MPSIINNLLNKIRRITPYTKTIVLLVLIVLASLNTNHLVNLAPALRPVQRSFSEVGSLGEGGSSPNSLPAGVPLSGTKEGNLDNTASVLATSTSKDRFMFAVNVDSFFKKNASFTKNVDIKGVLTAPNLFQGISAGQGIALSGDTQNPTITSLGVLSVQGQTGALSLTGSGINIEGTKLTNTGVLSLQGESGDLDLSSGSGISISGLSISNSDTGSSQNIFKTITVGATSFSAGSNNDTLSFASGTGITITSDTTNKLLTISSTGGGTGSSTNWWDSASGAIYPNNSTKDLLVGGVSTSSAKFAFLNVLTYPN